ncbi:helix-hairpin-helix domain-containing protein [Parabacteroides sp. 52]|uniref:ComEA family DNA-binding protein n=1 Tax=unclassified Parabacteroides TaxID=2649774 RepID=UPI0013D62CCA|nr:MULTISPECIES: helix-hairpin-helix domain-containing protein [unclassified Parabacteroides]MDH6534365.1 competence protein ComEA [Parabacteroides sp. PM5-20]NDV54863.1 helix-hairpin-helix domain-containing protein [Parabacteroides sp. 52]
MHWRDFFYFSKGERRALTFLLCLITAAWLALILTDHRGALVPGSDSISTPVVSPVCIYLPEKEEKRDPQQEEKEIIPPSEKKSPIKQLLSPSKKAPFYQTIPQTEKYRVGTIVELNTADTVVLKKVPGIGSTFSRRIIKYRELLGGFYSVEQLAEVYGIDEDRFQKLKQWFCVNDQLILKSSFNSLSFDSLNRHPYLNYKQVRAIQRLHKQKGKLTGWENLLLLEEFTASDMERLKYYFCFE